MDLRFIGDIERLIATNLYPIRVPIAIGLALVVVALLWIARRGRWDQAARRRPGRTAVLVVAVLAIGLPLGWYLGSPLFISNRLVEPPPPIASSPPASPPPASAAPSATTAPPVSASPVPAAAVVASGSFTGADEFHFGRGTAAIVETGTGRYTLRFEDFAVRNGPDLFVYLSPDEAGYVNGALELGRLKADQGAFNYDLPEGTDPGSYASVVVWCKQFAVQFAVAPLGSA